MNKIALAAVAAAVGVAGPIAFGGANAAAPIEVAQAEPDPAVFAAMMTDGQDGYERNCRICHGNEGQGVAGPKLAGNDFVASSTAIVSQIIFGYEDHGMPPFGDHLNDHVIAAIATYVRNSWGNEFGLVTETTVAANRP
jgi:mono/diheme cytochrome c family protein